MAVFYQGARPVLKGRNASDNVNPYTGQVAVYSNYSIYNTSHVLDGAPNNDHVIGTGRHPHDLKMSRLFRGLENNEQPLKDPGAGAALSWYYKLSTAITRQGEGTQDVFASGYGHADRVTSYSLWEPWTYRGVTDAPLDGTYGHARRGVDAAGTANSFGTLGLFDYHGVTPEPLEDAGDALADKPTGNEYGFQKVNEWKGVPSARVL